jgi:CheY-like chemotaxis protein
LDQSFRRSVLFSSELHRALGREDCYLHRPAFALHSGRDGGEILELAARLAPDAVLIEYGLPDRAGDEVCRDIKRAGGRTPVLIIGPAQPPSIREACREAGCDDFLEIPIAPNLVLSRLAAFLGIQFRLHARVPAVVSISSGRVISEFLGYTRDISEGGLLVEAAVRMDEGRRLHLRLYLEDQERPVRAPATVLRVEPVTGEERYLIGMRFSALEPVASERIREFIRRRSAGH